MRARILTYIALALWAGAYLLSFPMLALLTWAEAVEKAAQGGGDS